MAAARSIASSARAARARRPVVTRRLLAAMLTLGVLLGVAQPPAADAATPRTALLAEADLPDGWTAADAPGPAASAYAWCPGGSAALPVSPIDRAGRVFSRGPVGPLVYQDVLQFAPGETHAAFAAVRAHPEPCDWAELTTDDSPMLFHLGAASELPLGDGAVARRLEAEWDGVLLSADVIVIRRGEFVAVLAHVALGRESVAVDTDLTRRLATAVAGKLAHLPASAPDH